MLTEEQINISFNNKSEAIDYLADYVEKIIILKNTRAAKLAEAVSAGLYAECKNEDQ